MRTQEQGENDCLALLVVTAPTSTFESISRSVTIFVSDRPSRSALRRTRPKYYKHPTPAFIIIKVSQADVDYRLPAVWEWSTMTVYATQRHCPKKNAHPQWTIDIPTLLLDVLISAKDMRSHFEQDNLFVRYRFIFQTRRRELALATTNTCTDVRKGRFKTTNLR